MTAGATPAAVQIWNTSAATPGVIVARAASALSALVGAAFGSDGRLYAAAPNGSIAHFDPAVDGLDPKSIAVASNDVVGFTLGTSTGPDVLVWIEGAGKLIQQAKLDGSGAKSAPLADTPAALVLGDGARTAFVLTQGTTNESVQSVDLHRLALGETPVLGPALATGANATTASTGIGRSLIALDDKLFASYLDGVAVLGIDAADCGATLGPHGCPQCASADCIVLATVNGYQPGFALDDPLVPPSDPMTDSAAQIARIDNLLGRVVVPSVADLAAAVTCLLERGEGGVGPQGPPGQDGKPGGPGAPGAGIDAVTAQFVPCNQPGSAMLSGSTLDLVIPKGCDGEPGAGLDWDLPHICSFNWIHGDMNQKPPQGKLALIVAFDTDVTPEDLDTKSIHVQLRTPDEKFGNLLQCWCDLDLDSERVGTITPGRLKESLRPPAAFRRCSRARWRLLSRSRCRACRRSPAPLTGRSRCACSSMAISYAASITRASNCARSTPIICRNSIRPRRPGRRSPASRPRGCSPATTASRATASKAERSRAFSDWQGRRDGSTAMNSITDLYRQRQRQAASVASCAPPPLVCTTCGMLECVCRPRFFAGQLLNADDLNRLDAYIRAKNRLHNRQLHGWGVVNGLEVTCNPCGAGVTVSCGYALSPCGEDIVVCDATQVDVCTLIQRCKDAERLLAPCDPPSQYVPGKTQGPCDAAEEDWVLAIRYAEAPARGIKPLYSSSAASCGCGCGGNGGSGCTCKSGGVASGCGCASTGARSGSTARAPRGASAQCEATVICEGFEFEVYRVPPEGSSDQRPSAADSPLLQRFECCVQDLVSKTPQAPAQGDAHAFYLWALRVKDFLLRYLQGRPGYQCEADRAPADARNSRSGERQQRRSVPAGVAGAVRRLCRCAARLPVRGAPAALPRAEPGPARAARRASRQQQSVQRAARVQLEHPPQIRDDVPRPAILAFRHASHAQRAQAARTALLLRPRRPLSE